MKNFFVFILITSISFICCSCFDKVELEDRSFVVSMGIDKSTDGISLSLAIPDMSEKSDNKKVLKTVEGKTISDAISNANDLSANALDFRHTKVLIVNKEVLKDGKQIAEVMDILQRNKQLSNKTILLGTDESAKKILETPTKEDKLLSEYVTDFYTNNKNTEASCYNKDLMTILQSMGFGQTVIIPKIQVEDGDIKLNDGLIIKDFTYVADVNDELTRGYAYILGKGSGITLTTEFEQVYTSSKISSEKNKINFYEENGTLVMDNNIKCIGAINGYSFDKGQLTDTKKINELESIYKNIVINESNKSWDFIVQQNNADGFNIKDTLRKKNYDLYLKYANENPNFLKSIKFVPNVEFKINGVGSVK